MLLPTWKRYRLRQTINIPTSFPPEHPQGELIPITERYSLVTADITSVLALLWDMSHCLVKAAHKKLV